MRTLLGTSFFLLGFLGLIYFAIRPVSIMPEAWTAPPNPGYSGPFEANKRLANLEVVSINRHVGPEAVAQDDLGRLYTGTEDGKILKLSADGQEISVYADTKGRPLGLAFDQKGRLIVADAALGLLSVAKDGKVTLLTNSAGGDRIGFANDLAIADDGRIYFTDASSKFAPRYYPKGHKVPLGLIATDALLEHGSNGRLMVYDPLTEQADILVNDLNFPNGVTLSHDRKAIIFTEMGGYRVLRYWLEGEKKGSHEVLAAALPGFPDNITTGTDGRYWIAFVAPRDRVMDLLSNWPRVRKFIRRLPPVFRPQAKPYGHIIAIDDNGRVVRNLQDPSGRFPMISSVLETDRFLYLGSFAANHLARLNKKAAGL